MVKYCWNSKVTLPYNMNSQKMRNSQATEEPGGKNVKISVNPANQVGYKVVLGVMFVSHQRKLFLILDLLSVETHKTLSLT